MRSVCFPLYFTLRGSHCFSRLFQMPLAILLQISNKSVLPIHRMVISVVSLSPHLQEYLPSWLVGQKILFMKTFTHVDILSWHMINQSSSIIYNHSCPSMEDKCEEFPRRKQKAFCCTSPGLECCLCMYMLLWPIVPSLRVGSSLLLNFNLLQISLIGNLGKQVIRKEDMNIQRVYSVITLRLVPWGKDKLVPAFWGKFRVQSVKWNSCVYSWQIIPSTFQGMQSLERIHAVKWRRVENIIMRSTSVLEISVWKCCCFPSQILTVLLCLPTIPSLS